MATMFGRPVGTVLLATAFLVAGLAGIATFVSAWPRTSGTSPLVALSALVWGCAWLATALLTWRGSHLAGLLFVAAMALLLFPAKYLVPGGHIFLPSLVMISALALLGYRYLTSGARTAA